MAPTAQVALSPAELSYLYTSLSQTPPIRPDGRSPTEFRRLIAETDILPSTNGSARICFADGTEAIVGVKASVERTKSAQTFADSATDAEKDTPQPVDDDGWLQVAIEIPGFQSDDTLPVFLAAMLTEAMLADGTLKHRLCINSRFHWGLYLDILLLSPPLSYPLPLLSLTIHLALLQTRLPALISEKEEDPMFNDDWDAATRLYPSTDANKPPITLLVITVGPNVIFDATREELAVADYVLAVSACRAAESDADADAKVKSADTALQVLSMRAIDPPARMTNTGVPDSLNAVTGGTAPADKTAAFTAREMGDGPSVWRPPRGGVSRSVLAQMINEVVRSGGVGAEVLDALQGFET